MSNNRFTKMFALVMSIVMLLCMMSMTAFANGIDEETVVEKATVPELEEGSFLINEDADFSVKYFLGNEEIANISNADRSKQYTLLLDVYKKNDVAIPSVGNFFFKLPDEVAEAENGSDSNAGVKWEANNGVLAFTWLNGMKTSFTIKISVKLANVFDLYNIAVIRLKNASSDTYYRLAKTTIKAIKPYDKYSSGAVLSENDYTAEDYDFSTTKVVISNVEYSYFDGDLDEYLKDPKPVYTVQLVDVTSSHRGIGGLGGWFLPEGTEQYNDANNTNGFHRNYRITLAETMSEQPLFNFAIFNGKYYRLKKTTILAAPATSYKSGVRLQAGEYIWMGDYDFTNLVLIKDKKEYRYSATEKTGIYDNYYTVTKGELLAKDRIHSNSSWYTNKDGWIDGAEETYTEAEKKNNNTYGYHQDYNISLHNGTATFYSVKLNDEEASETIRVMKNEIAELPVPTKDGFSFTGWNTAGDASGVMYDAENPLKVTKDITLYAQWEEASIKKVTISSSLEGVEKVFAGTEITLTAVLEGFEGECTYQWQYEDPANPGMRIEISGANSKNYTFNLDKTNCHYIYYVVVTPIE